MNPRLNRVIQDLNADAILISNSKNIFYLTSFNEFSQNEKEAYLLLTKSNCFIFTDSRFFNAVKKYIPGIELVEINSEFNFEHRFSKLIKDYNINTISVNFIETNLNEYIMLKKYVKIIDDNNLLKNIREQKDNLEIKYLKTAAKITDQIFNLIINDIKSNITENELAAKIENHIISKGIQKSFAPIVAFGKNSALPHHKPQKNKLLKNQMILLDFGVNLNGYCSDMSRTLFFGKADKKFKEIYSIVLNSQINAVNYIEHNLKNNHKISLFEIDKTARDYILEKKYPSIPHAVGHGIGLDVHEIPTISPKSKSDLNQNSVFTIEPGIYLNNYGGVRIENMYLIKNNKIAAITNAKKDLIEL